MAKAVWSKDVEGSPGFGYIGRIPIRNIWLLMFYASDLFRQRGNTLSRIEDAPDDIAELVATILSEVVTKRLLRNLTSGYRHRHQNLTRVRGRIDQLTTERHQLLSRGKVCCHYEELTVDTPRNRYVRAALLKAARLVKHELSHRCRVMAGTLERLGVGTQVPSKSEIVADQTGRHDKDDRMMLAAANLVFQLSLPTEVAGTRALPMPEREEQWARKLFEKAVAGFYDHALSSIGWQVWQGRTLTWELAKPSTNISSILPRMMTDIWLDHSASSRRIIIDTKFTNIVTVGQYGSDSLKSGYIYQLYAYLRAQEQEKSILSETATGVLLHPAINQDVRESAVIHGHEIKFRTIDLTASTHEIREQMLSAVGEFPVHDDHCMS